MPRKKGMQKKVEDGLLRLAVGEVSDAVSLLFLSSEEALERLPHMNLLNISDIKLPKGGGMEIKFFDRLKALECLREQTADNTNEGLSFYQALEKSTENTERVAEYD